MYLFIFSLILIFSPKTIGTNYLFPIQVPFFFFLPRVETRGIIEAIYSEPVTETKSMLNSQRKSI